MQPADLTAKLEALHDIVVPAPVPWWPPAPGWYAVLVLAVAFAGWAAWRLYRRWRGNAYRRTALRRLAAIRAQLADPGRRPAALIDLATLLRRAALHVVPRERVAALSGDAWLDFLDAGMGGHAFHGDAGRLVTAAPYQPAARIAQIPMAELDALCGLVERWLRKHRVSRYVSRPPHPNPPLQGAPSLASEGRSSGPDHARGNPALAPASGASGRSPPSPAAAGEGWGEGKQ